MPHGQIEAVDVPEGVQTMDDFSSGPEQSCAFDGDYVRRLAEGDRFVEDHFTAYFGGLLSVKLRARVRSREMIEEVRQETFARVLQVLRQRGGLEHPERLGAFVNSVCKNVLFEKFREQARYRQTDPASDDWPDSRINLDAPLINQERKRLVEKVLAELPKRDAELLRMVFLEEADKAEACRRLGVGEDYLRVLLHRAKLRFREKLMKHPRSVLERLASWSQRDPVKQSRHAAHYMVRCSDAT